MAINSVFRYTLPVVIGTVLSSTFVAYGFAKVKWPGRDIVFFICMLTMMLPWQVTMVPLFITFKNLDWINSYRPLVVPSFFGSAYFIFLLRQFFKSIPEELSDAARIDGASEVGILFRIILPLAKPALALHLYLDLEQLFGSIDLYQPGSSVPPGIGHPTFESHCE